MTFERRKATGSKEIRGQEGRESPSHLPFFSICIYLNLVPVLSPDRSKAKQTQLGE